MKISVRKGVFESNSSSMHSMTMCLKSDYDKWKNENLFLFQGCDWEYEGNNPEFGKFYTREEAIEFGKRNKNVDEDFNWEHEKSVLDWLHENDWCDHDYYWEEEVKYYDTFEESFVTPSGDEVVSFGFYGDDL